MNMLIDIFVAVQPIKTAQIKNVFTSSECMYTYQNQFLMCRLVLLCWCHQICEMFTHLQWKWENLYMDFMHVFNWISAVTFFVYVLFQCAKTNALREWVSAYYHRIQSENIQFWIRSHNVEFFTNFRNILCFKCYCEKSMIFAMKYILN